MKKRAVLQMTATIFYAVISALFISFMIYMSLCEENALYSARAGQSYDAVEDYTVGEIIDDLAPVGIRKEYRWTLDTINTNDNCLAFYLVHQYAEVWFDGELMYSLMPGENNRIGTSPSSNWIFVPIYRSDSGREVRVAVTPVYQSVSDREIEFEIGSRFTIMTNRLKADLPQLVFSMMCILLGFFLMIVQLCLILQKKTYAWDIFYLGNFLLLIGIWRITDTRFSSLMFSSNPMALGYITIGALFIVCAPLLLSIKERFVGRRRTVLLAAVLAICIVAFAALLCQVFGIAEFRETLMICHIMLVLCIVVLLWVSLSRRQEKLTNMGSFKFIALLGAGALADLIYYYANGSSSGILFTVVVLLIYTSLRFFIGILKINRRAYIDAHTGLFNKGRWDELMGDKVLIAGPVGIIVLDINSLKHINDTLGHEAGDKLILDFANILHNTIPSNNTICRWGGDEFAILITGADRDKLEAYANAVATAVEEYNASENEPKIFYSAGWALSSDFPRLGRKELFEKADERMYQNKRQWYAANTKR